MSECVNPATLTMLKYKLAYASVKAWSPYDTIITRPDSNVAIRDQICFVAPVSE